MGIITFMFICFGIFRLFCFYLCFMAKQIKPTEWSAMSGRSVPSGGVDVNAGKSWLAHWLSNRRLQLAENSGGTRAGSQAASGQNRNLFSVPAYGSVEGMNSGYTRDHISGLDSAGLGSGPGSLVAGQRAGFRKNILTHANNEMSVPGTRGTYVADNMGNRVAVAANNPDGHQSVMVHELAHSMEAKPQESKISDIMKGAKINGGSNSYLESPTEIHSRLMQIRHDLGLDPRKNYTIDDLKDLRQGDKKYNILDRYDDETILRLLNDVASVSKGSDGPVNS